MSDRPAIILAMQSFIAIRGRAPTADEVYGLADFRQPGGIGRLTEGLAWLASEWIARRPAA